MKHKPVRRIGHGKSFSVAVWVLAMMIAGTTAVKGQAGFPDRLRKYSDNGNVSFSIGTTVTLTGGQSRNPVNGYQPGLLTNSAQDRAYQAVIQGQFNQIEPSNELKMRSVWTGGAALVNGNYVAKTNLFDQTGPLNQLCAWAERQRSHLTVRGHCMVYYQRYTLPAFPKEQPALFVQNSAGKTVLNPPYQPNDLRDMLQSYVQQVVDATMAQNALSRVRYGYKVLGQWDVTNEVISDSAGDTIWPQLGFAYRRNDPWYNNGPGGSQGINGYDYVGDIYRWATLEMNKNVGAIIGGQNITADDKFKLYYNDYGLEENATKMTHVLSLIKHIRKGSARVDGIGFQGHVGANGLKIKQFETNINAAISAGLRFSVTEADCTIDDLPAGSRPSLAQQEINQGQEYGEIARLCVTHQDSCDCFQIWGATDDGSWLQNKESTPVTRWVTDTRPGLTIGKIGYWPKEGQYSPATRTDPATGTLDSNSGHTVSSAYDQILAALKAR